MQVQNFKNFFEKALDNVLALVYNKNRKGVNHMDDDKVVRAIEKAGRVVDALVQLGLKVGTLIIAIIKMIADAVQ